MVNTRKLKGRIMEQGQTINKIAAMMHMTPYTLGRKISNQSEMTLSEANDLQNILAITDREFKDFFYTA